MDEFQKFVNMVSEMRSCQKQYFKTRDQEWLNRSKRFEKMVDSEIERLIKPNLFN